MIWCLENGLLSCCQPIQYESLSLGLKIADILYQPLLESEGLFYSKLWSGIIVCPLDFARYFWDVLVYCCETPVREFLVPQPWLNRGLNRNSSLGLFCFTPRTLENGGELIKYNFLIFSIICWLSTFQFFHSEKALVVITPCDLICFLILWTIYYSKFYPVLNWYSVIKVLINDTYYFAKLYYYITLFDLINFEIFAYEKTFHLTF